MCVENEEVGFLPGSLSRKMEPWTRPFFDLFNEMMTLKVIESMVQKGIIEIAPLAYMRGRTFKKAFVIADEMQNSTPNQMLMLLTRIGDESKLVVTGDAQQSDLPLHQNGLTDFIGKYRSMTTPPPAMKLVEFNETDVFRSPLVSLILDMYKKPEIKTHRPNHNHKQDNDAAMIPKHMEANLHKYKL